MSDEEVLRRAVRIGIELRDTREAFPHEDCEECDQAIEREVTRLLKLWKRNVPA